MAYSLPQAKLRNAPNRTAAVERRIAQDASFQAVARTGLDRLYPSIFSPAYLELRERRIHIERFFKSSGGASRVLEVGAQHRPYLPVILNTCKKYIAIDMCYTPGVDVICNGDSIAIRDSSVDIVLCTQVLEHCGSPQRIVDECLRVLTPRGTLILTVPSVFPVHGSPGDYWRYMPQGIELLLKGFSSVRVMGEMDFAESWVSVNLYYLHVLTGRLGGLGRFLNAGFAFVGNVAARILGMAVKPFVRHSFQTFSMNYWAQAIK